MTTTTATLDGIPLATAVPDALILRVRRSLTGRVRTDTIDVPRRAGSWRFPESPGDARVTIELDITADTFTERRAACRALAEWIAPALDGEVQLILDDEPDRFYTVMLDSAADPDEWLVAASVTLDFTADPYTYSTTISTETVNASGTPDSGTFNLAIDYPAEPVIEITPTNGTLSSFVLTVNGETIEWTGDTLASGETITISSISDTVSVGENVDVNLTGAFDPVDAEQGIAGVSATGFPELVPGINEWAISWTGTATTVDVVFTYRARSL